tara:strand:+ start:841 stop:1107 length:267 start_codon:yes stop_codon:yes gene_type:complete
MLDRPYTSTDQARTVSYYKNAREPSQQIPNTTASSSPSPSEHRFFGNWRRGSGWRCLALLAIAAVLTPVLWMVLDDSSLRNQPLETQR